MKNKKGFTLIELLAVLVILGIVSFIAVPNVVELINGNKKETILSDARKMLSQAKYEVATNKSVRDIGSYTYYLSDLAAAADLKMDPNGNPYDTANSYVKYAKINNVDTYCVYLVSREQGENRLGDIKMIVGQTNAGKTCSPTDSSTGSCTCVSESNLFSRDRAYLE